MRERKELSPLILTGTNELQFLPLGSAQSVVTESVGHFDDGASHAIHIPNGFPFEGTLHTTAFVSGI